MKWKYSLTKNNPFMERNLLLELLEEKNAKLEADSVKFPGLGYAPRKLEEY